MIYDIPSYTCGIFGSLPILVIDENDFAVIFFLICLGHDTINKSSVWEITHILEAPYLGIFKTCQIFQRGFILCASKSDISFCFLANKFFLSTLATLIWSFTMFIRLVHGILITFILRCLLTFNHIFRILSWTTMMP